MESWAGPGNKASFGYPDNIFLPTAADSPANFNAYQLGPSSFIIFWTPPATVTGYHVYWSGGSDSGNMSVGAGSSNVRISGLFPNLTYNITMVALSDHLPSPAVVVMVYTLGETHSYIEGNYWRDLLYCVCHNSKFVYCYIECTVHGGMYFVYRYFHTVLKCNNADLLYKKGYLTIDFH